MLRKLKVTMLVGAALQLLRAFAPGLEIPEDFEAAVKTLVDMLFVIVPVLVGWITPESQALVDKLDTTF